MPRGFEPGVRLPFVLEDDKGKDNPPTFYLRALSARESVPVNEVLDRAISAGGLDTIERIEEVENMITANLLGWSNLFDSQGKPIEYGNGTKIGSICDKRELCQLLAAIYNGCWLTVDEKKN